MMLFVGTAAFSADPFSGMGVSILPAPYPASTFSIPSTDGGKVSLESVRGKVVLLYFGASW
jgi:cytochrome oxidase Cu insertion factor (SCO1/SenC/PrrC family)